MGHHVMMKADVSVWMVTACLWVVMECLEVTQKKTNAGYVEEIGKPVRLSAVS